MPVLTYAVRGQTAVQDLHGEAQQVASILVKAPDGSTATLYTDRTKAHAAANPAASDSFGQFVFFSDQLGVYTLRVTTRAGTFDRLVEAEVDPADDAYASDVAAALAAAEAYTDTAVVANGLSYGLHVKSYGAVGDGVVDDTAAVQAALTAAVSRGVPLIVDQGTFNVEQLAVTGAESVVVIGYGPGRSTLRLRSDDGLGGLGQILVLTDVIRFSLRDIGFNGNFAGAKVSTIQNPLVKWVTTVATQGRTDLEVDVDNVEFTESAKGWGHLRVHVFETNSSNYSELATLRVTNCRFTSHGNFFSAVSMRGPARNVHFEDISIRNDGVYGMQAYGQVTSSGSGAFPLAATADINNGHFIRNFTANNIAVFRSYGSMFLQMIKNAMVDGVAMVEDCTNPYYDTVPQTFTADAATNVLTLPDGLPAGAYGNQSIVIPTSTGTLPAPLISGQMYFVVNLSGSTFKLSTVSSGAAIDLTDAGTGVHSLQFKGFTYGVSLKGDDNLHSTDDPARHVLKKVVMIRSTPHTAHRSLSYEESVPLSVGAVILDDCRFDNTVALLEGAIDHEARNCTFDRGYYPNVTQNTGSSLAIRSGLVHNCDFTTSRNSPSFGVLGDLTVSECTFFNGLAITQSQTVGQSILLRLFDNVWNADDASTARLTITPPMTGFTTVVQARGNRIPPQSAQQTLLRIPATNDYTGLTLLWDNNDLGTDAVVGNALLVRMQGRNNRNLRRAESDIPSVLANSATPSVEGAVTWVTAGGGTRITNFTNSADDVSIKVKVLSGDTIGATATIVTNGNTDISGPGVHSFYRAGGVWYQVGSNPNSGSLGLATFNAGARLKVSTVAASGAAQTLDSSASTAFVVTLTANCTFTFSGALTGYECWFILEINAGAGGFVATFPTAQWDLGLGPPAQSTAAGAVDLYAFMTRDGGTTWRGFDLGRAVA